MILSWDTGLTKGATLELLLRTTNLMRGAPLISAFERGKEQSRIDTPAGRLIVQSRR